jgi:hypothetical protein
MEMAIEKAEAEVHPPMSGKVGMDGMFGMDEIPVGMFGKDENRPGTAPPMGTLPPSIGNEKL